MLCSYTCSNSASLWGRRASEQEEKLEKHKENESPKESEENTIKRQI